MKKDKYIFLIMIVSVMIFYACGSNNTEDDEQFSDEISLSNEFSFDILGGSLVGYQWSDSHIMFVSVDDPMAWPIDDYIYFDAYELTTGEKIYNAEESGDIYLPIATVYSDDYLVYLLKNMQTNRYIIKRYSFIDEEMLSLEVDDQTNYGPAETPIQIYGDSILVNLTTGHNGEGKTFVINANLMTRSDLLTSYDMKNTIMDGTFESLYGGANKIVDHQIVMSSYNYIDTYNQVDIFDLNDLSITRSLKASSNQEEVCNIIHAQIIEPYIALKSICTDDLNKFVIYNLQDENEVINIDLPFSINDFKIKDINDEYILITNGNNIKDNSETMVYNRFTNVIEDIPMPFDNLEYYGATSYLFDDLVLVVNNQELFVYDLENKAYILMDTTYQICPHSVLGIYKNQLIFYGEFAGKQAYFSYHIVKQEFNMIMEMDVSEQELTTVNITDFGLLLLVEGRNPKAYILD